MVNTFHKRVKWLVVGLLSAVSGSWAATVAPLYFTALGESATENTEQQQDRWESLMKYKLWGTHSLVFSNGNISISDNTGYNGTADGDFTVSYPYHHIGGPTLIGGDISFNDGGDDTLTVGPVRALGNMQVSIQDNNVFQGAYCIKGSITEQYYNNKKQWIDIVTANGGSIFEGDDYANCPDTVPQVETEMEVPVLPADAPWTDEVIDMTSCYDGEVLYVHVPPDTVYQSTTGSYDKYIKSMRVKCTAGKRLYFLMPPEGRLTRIFSQEGFFFNDAVNDLKIQVVYVNEGTTFDKKKNKWDIKDTTGFKYLSNTDYSGNLLFYTPEPIDWSYWKSAEFQGSWMSASKITIGGHFKLAGQIVAENIYIQADVQGDFRYVPFDPPVADPTATEESYLQETDRAQEIAINLSEKPTTAVDFDYCFVLSSGADFGTGLANAKDFNDANMPICTVNSDGTIKGTSSSVHFKALSENPDVPITVTPIKDGLVEGTETFKMYIFNMSGAVLKGNVRSGYFNLKIKDADEEHPPKFDSDSYSFKVNEHSSVGDSVGIVHATDPEADQGDIPYYYIASGDSDIFALDSISGKITVKKPVLDYEIKDTIFHLYIYASDTQMNSDTVPVTIYVKDINEKPILADTSFTVPENMKVGDTVGVLVGFDPDSLHKKEFGTITYKNISDTTVFKVDPTTGTITLKNQLDYETKPSYTLRVVASDGQYSDTATVTVNVTNVNEPPTLEKTTVKIKEDCTGCSADQDLKATDPDGDPLTFKVVSDTSGLFTIDPTTGRISLKDGKKLDYEKDSVYTIQVSVTDPKGLSDTTAITVKVTNEKEKVEITYAQSGDSSWTKPDTIRTNDPKVYIKWTTPDGEKDSTVSVSEGPNTITVTYQDGKDQVVVILSTKIPVVYVKASNDTTDDPSGVTIVEQKDKDDTASYVRSKNAIITIAVVDSSTEKPTLKQTKFAVTLDTAKVTSSNIKTVEATVGKVNLVDESDLPSKVKVTRSVLGENLRKVSYYDTTSAGTVVMVSYYTDANGKRLKNTDGDEYYEVSYTFKDADGKKVTLTYEVDALGSVKTDKDGNTLYTVNYIYTAKSSDTSSSYNVDVSYTINSKGVETTDADGNLIYTVGYTFTDSYGNSNSATTLVIVDTVPPKVKIISPEDSLVTSNVSIAIKWTVNDVEQDTLLYQGLNDGKNLIIRTYRDKAGNETSDTIVVILKAGKLVEVEMEETLVSSDPDRVEKYTSVSNSKPGTTYALSVMNAKTGEEIETQAGTKDGVTEGTYKEPYTGKSGKHLGATLSITAQAPAVDQTGTSSTLASVLENGYVSLDSGGGWNRKKIPLDDYLEDYCSVDFKKAYDSLGNGVSLYTTTIQLKIWFFNTLGEYVSDYSFKQDIGTENVDPSGAIQLYFELKPDEEGYLKTPEGRKLGTGAYIFNSEVKIRSVLQCDLPDHKRGYIRKDDDRILTKWGYRRPDNK